MVKDKAAPVFARDGVGGGAYLLLDAQAFGYALAQRGLARAQAPAQGYDRSRRGGEPDLFSQGNGLERASA